MHKAADVIKYTNKKGPEKWLISLNKLFVTMGVKHGVYRFDRREV